MKKILIVSARHLKENPYREISLVDAFRKHNYIVTFIFPSRNLNKNGYKKEIVNDFYFKKFHIKFVSSYLEMASAIFHNDIILFGSWKQYNKFAKLARTLGKTVLNFNSTSGLDHWGHGVDYSLIKGRFSKRYFIFLQVNQKNNVKIPESKIIITGSIIHIYPTYLKKSIQHNDFIKKYGVSKPIAVLFPKAIGGMEKKVPTWFKNWPPQKCYQYCEQLNIKYKEIIEQLTSNGFDVIVKLHPTAYTEYLTTYNKESKYWKQFSNIKILEADDTYSCYLNMTVGIGITTHSALDTGYYKKPFIYVDSDKFEIPKNNRVFQIQKLTSLPIGPSSHWNKENICLNQWFPSWLGFYCTIDNLKLTLNDIKNNPNTISQEQHEMFMDEFWGGAYNDPVSTIVHETKKIKALKINRSVSQAKFFLKDLLSKW